MLPGRDQNNEMVYYQLEVPKKHLCFSVPVHCSFDNSQEIDDGGLVTTRFLMARAQPSIGSAMEASSVIGKPVERESTHSKNTKKLIHYFFTYPMP